MKAKVNQINSQCRGLVMTLNLHDDTSASTLWQRSLSSVLLNQMNQHWPNKVLRKGCEVNRHKISHETSCTDTAMGWKRVWWKKTKQLNNPDKQLWRSAFRRIPRLHLLTPKGPKITFSTHNHWENRCFKNNITSRAAFCLICVKYLIHVSQEGLCITVYVMQKSEQWTKGTMHEYVCISSTIVFHTEFSFFLTSLFSHTCCVIYTMFFSLTHSHRLIAHLCSWSWILWSRRSHLTAGGATSGASCWRSGQERSCPTGWDGRKSHGQSDHCHCNYHSEKKEKFTSAITDIMTS